LEAFNAVARAPQASGRAAARLDSGQAANRADSDLVSTTGRARVRL